MMLLVAAVGGFGFVKGYGIASDKAELAMANYIAQQEKLYNELALRKNKVDEKIVTEYVDKIVYITKWRTKNVEIVKVVPDTGQLSNGWVHVHDASAKGGDANSTAASDGSPSGITAAEGLGTVADNYGSCHETAERLIKLQSWIREQQKIYGVASNGK